MSQHPREALGRFDQMSTDDPERAAVAAHLELCAPCRTVIEAFREIDRVVAAPSGRLPGFSELERRLESTAGKMRRASRAILAVVAGQVVLGAIAIYLLTDRAILVAAGVVFLLADSVLLVGMALRSRSQAHRYEEVAESWDRGRSLWRGHLAADARASLIAAVVSGLLFALGAAMLGTGAGTDRLLPVAVGSLLTAVGLLGLLVHPRRRIRARRELRVFDDLYPLRDEGCPT
ncbi:MAG TPA: hypothetical protein VF530_22480 [Planctomycetota bacterium]